MARPGERIAARIAGGTAALAFVNTLLALAATFVNRMTVDHLRTERRGPRGGDTGAGTAVTG